ncbi:proteasome activator subunit 4-like isoform X1 [Amaranthus tricolor]|uniref:proteasome activator subunit 4-like isoform X1 n=1 Tax=Amaranthus tricolor TaxID=29722 RepID=UPI002588DCAF|nr:proteasome activator subunit 4-like isoform X1 [Amaranthus tricolor]
MHLYNSWLPPPIVQETIREKEAFSRVVLSLNNSYHPGDPDSVYATLKWISVIHLFLKAKSELSLEDVELLVKLGLDIFHASCHKLYAQGRWGNLLLKFINKYRKKLSLTIQWRPLYDTLVRTHFNRKGDMSRLDYELAPTDKLLLAIWNYLEKCLFYRSIGPEGWRVKQRHFETITALVRACRRFFPKNSALEIWSEFSPLLENPWHNSSFEGSGFIKLFLPTNLDNQGFFSQAWIEKCLEVWSSIPNCHFWNSQWAAILARVTKNYDTITWEPLLPILFAKYLNMFEVPVANGASSYPYSVSVPRNTRFLFSNKTSTPSKAIAKSIVYLLRPGSSAQEHFDKLINLLEQYYHPSNGGRWTYSMERFLLYLVIMFQKRLQYEQKILNDSRRPELYLGKLERVSFVSTVLKLIDRGQYSKNDHLSETVATATSILSFVEPSIVLPFVASRFHMALETMTATHQLKTAVTSVAYTGRSLFFTSLSSTAERPDDSDYPNSIIDLLVISLSNALLGMDANDPPKTLATMQLIGSIFSNMAVIEDSIDNRTPISAIRFSEWLDEFLCRLFSLLLHLEPNSVTNEGLNSVATSGTFLVEDGPYYFCMLEILFGKLSESLFTQALKKISKFVQTNILPGAVAEVGLLCCACVHSNREEAVVHLVEPMLSSVISSMNGMPRTGFVSGTFASSFEIPSISPALEVAIDYQLKVLSVCISYGGPHLLRCKDQFKEAINLAFESPSWKINGAGDHLLRSLLGSLVLYYPIDQYRCALQHPDVPLMEKWMSTKDFSSDKPLIGPKWHVPVLEEISYANELLSLHFQSALDALDSLVRICPDKIHISAGNEKDYLKVTLLRIDSSLQGVLSCLPDFNPSLVTDNVEDTVQDLFLLAGAAGARVGSTEMRVRAAQVIHATCRYLLEKKPDDSILLILIIRVMDALINYGSLEFDEWSNHRQAWKLESAAIVEPSVNFVTSSHSNGKRRPLWALADKAYMHNTWRASQSSFHLYRTSGNVSPSSHAILLMDDLLDLALYRYETVRSLAARSLLKMLKRWPSMVSKCMVVLTEKLTNPSSPEYAVLGSCTILSDRTLLKHLTMDSKAFTSFTIGILKSAHHESLKAQKAITELFVKFNILFSGVPKNLFKASNSQSDGQLFVDLISQIGSMSFDTNSLHWRYNLMANRVFLLVVMASRNNPRFSTQILSETVGHFLKNLRSQLPQTRFLAISALNTLLKESSHKMLAESSPENVEGVIQSSIEGALVEIFQEEGFFNETFNSLSHVHTISDGDTTSSRGNYGNASFQSVADKSITFFYFDFTASWPRTPSWISLFGSGTFYSDFARFFKRLIQECGISVLQALKSPLDHFASSQDRSKQCVAAEAFSGILHSDVNGLLEEWDDWVMSKLQDIIMAPSVESIPEWVSCIRYAVTGKGKHGTRVPLLRQKIMDCLLKPLPQTANTTVIAKRYAFLAAVFIEVSPPNMPEAELLQHQRLLNELLLNMSHSSAQVREAVGVILCVLCSNVQLHRLYARSYPDLSGSRSVGEEIAEGSWSQLLLDQATECAIRIQKTTHSDHIDADADVFQENRIPNDSVEDVKRMETLFHFVIALLKSGRALFLMETIVGILYPVISLQDISNKDLSTLAKAAFELLKWTIFEEPHRKNAVAVIHKSANDSNWRTRSATLTYLRSFMFRHNFVLPHAEKLQIWTIVEKLLIDGQVEVREHAAAVLAGLMKGGDEILAEDFRGRAFREATLILKKKQRKTAYSVAFVHGAVLALTACVLSVPYDMPSWLPEHVTLLARFVGEPSPVRSTVTKAVAEFRRTHADTWNFQREQFTEEQLEVLADTSSSSSYFA